MVSANQGEGRVARSFRCFGNLDRALAERPWPWAVLIGAGWASILLKPAAAYLTRVYFSYENAWDEAAYLAFQGAVAMKSHLLRWVSGNLVLGLHHLGLSGAAQNLLFDLATLALISGSIYWITRRLSGRPVDGLRMAWFGAFGAGLFNQANPLLRGAVANVRQAETLWAVAWESYLPWLRTPEPQLSLILLTVTVCAFFRFGRRPWILLLPVPFLYFFVAVGYGYFVGVFGLSEILSRSRVVARRWVLRALFANGAMILAGSIAFWVVGNLDLVRGLADDRLAAYTHGGRLSITLLWSLAALPSAWFIARPALTDDAARTWGAVSAAAIGLQLFITNQQVLSGVEIHPQGLQNIVGTGVSTLALCLLAQALALRGRAAGWQVARTGLLALATLWILLSLHTAQGLDLTRIRYVLFVNHDISRAEYERIRSDPLHAILPRELLASRMGLASPGLLVPPFGYQYQYPWFMAACGEAIEATGAAAAYVAKHHDSPELRQWGEDFDTRINRIARVAEGLEGEPRSRCGAGGIDAGRFFVIAGGAKVWLQLFRLF